MPVISYNVSNDSPIKMPLYYSMRLYYIGDREKDQAVCPEKGSVYAIRTETTDIDDDGERLERPIVYDRLRLASIVAAGSAINRERP